MNDSAHEMESQVTVVIGGAGGLGAAICHRLANAGSRVVVTYNKREQVARDLVAALAGDGHMAAQVAVEDSAALADLAARIEGEYGRVDVLVNCAGVTRFVPHHDLDALDDELIDRIFRVNCRGTIAGIRAFKNALEAGDGGLVVNISSIAGLTGNGSNVAYCASKAAVNSMTVSLARALAPKIRVVSVSPGLVDTELAKNFDPVWRADQIDKTPLKRLASPDDVGKAVVAAATHLTFTTGTIIPVDGGRPIA